MTAVAALLSCPTVCVQGPDSTGTPRLRRYGTPEVVDSSHRNRKWLEVPAAMPCAANQRRHSVPSIDAAAAARLPQLRASSRGSSARSSLTPSTASCSRQASLSRSSSGRPSRATTPSVGRTPSMGRTPTGGMSRTPSMAKTESRKGSGCGSIPLVRMKGVSRRSANEEATDDISPRFLRMAKAHILARRYGMPEREVDAVLEKFDRATRKSGGSLSFAGFCHAVASLELVGGGAESAWRASTGADPAPGACVGEFDAEPFVAWYATEHRWACLRSIRATPEELDRLAQLHGVSAGVMHLAARCFHHLDVKQRGQIDFEELQEGMRRNVRFNRLGEDAFLRIWAEIKQGGAGSIDFPEFAQWYLKFFEHDSRDLLVPTEAFYGSLQA